MICKALPKFMKILSHENLEPYGVAIYVASYVCIVTLSVEFVKVY